MSGRLAFGRLLQTTEHSAVGLTTWRLLLGFFVIIHIVEAVLYLAEIARTIKALGVSVLFASMVLWSIRYGKTPVQAKMVHADQEPAFFWLVVFTHFSVAAFLLYANISILKR